MKANKVLQDCKFCCWELENALEKNDQQRIRIQWIVCLTFLRMVGHVIDKADKKAFPNRHKIFEDLWREKKVESLFLNFIDKERNDALKEYETNIVPDKNEIDVNIGMLFQDGSRYLTQSGDRFVFNKTQKVVHFSSKKNEQGNKKRLDRWIEDGIDWWCNYLNELTDRLNVL